MPPPYELFFLRRRPPPTPTASFIFAATRCQPARFHGRHQSLLFSPAVEAHSIFSRCRFFLLQSRLSLIAIFLMFPYRRFFLHARRRMVCLVFRLISVCRCRFSSRRGTAMPRGADVSACARAAVQRYRQLAPTSVFHDYARPAATFSTPRLLFARMPRCGCQRLALYSLLTRACA